MVSPRPPLFEKGRTMNPLDCARLAMAISAANAANDPKALKKKVESLTAENAALKAEIAALKARTAKRKAAKNDND